MLAHFSNKPFLRHEAQVFSEYILANVYEVEQTAFNRKVQTVPLSELPPATNFIGRHFIYQIKAAYNKVLYYKL